MKILTLTVGLPRSGKTTWAMQQGPPVVNPDSIRLAMHGKPYISEAEPFVWAIAKVMVRALFLVGHDHVILDATSTSVNRRLEWKSRDWLRDYEKFNAPAVVCIERARAMDSTKDHIEGLVGAIERMAETFETVHYAEWDKEEAS